MQIKLNHIYKNADGEHFKAVEKDGSIVLKNPNYPFVFLPEVLMPLEEMGTDESLVEKAERKEYQFHEGESLSVEVKNGLLEVKK